MTFSSHPTVSNQTHNCTNVQIYLITIIISDTNEQVWIWNYGDNSKLYMDNGESIRFRLFREHFEESAPIPKETLMMARVAASAAGHDAEESSKPPILTTPYRLYGSVAEDGLGVTSWWGSNE